MGALWLELAVAPVTEMLYVPAGVPSTMPQLPPAAPSVVMLRATADSPLPEPTDAGLKVQLASAGNPEHDKATELANAPDVGISVTVNCAV
jgi:hypothetical protein